MAGENLILYVASYDDAAAAEADFKSLKEAQRAEDFAVVGAVVASRDEAGEVTVDEHGVASPVGGSAVLGAGAAVWWSGCSPRRCCSRPRSAPASAPASAGSKKRHEEKELGVDVEEYLPPGTSAVIVVADDTYADRDRPRAREVDQEGQQGRGQGRLREAREGARGRGQADLGRGRLVAAVRPRRAERSRSVRSPARTPAARVASQRSGPRGEQRDVLVARSPRGERLHEERRRGALARPTAGTPRSARRRPTPAAARARRRPRSPRASSARGRGPPVAVEAQHRQVAREAEHGGQVLVRLLLPAGAPDEVEIGAERLQVPGRGGRNQVRRPVHEHPGSRWTLIGREAEERDDAIDVDQEQRFAGVSCRSRGNRRTRRGVAEYPMCPGSVNPARSRVPMTRTVPGPAPPTPVPHPSQHDAPTRHPLRAALRHRQQPRVLLQAPRCLLGPLGRHPPPAPHRRPALVVEVVRDRHGRRRPRLAAARRGALARPDVHRAGGRRRRRRAHRRHGRPDLRHEGQPPPVVGPGPHGRRPRAARRDDAARRPARTPPTRSPR